MTQTALFKAMAKAFPKIEGALKDSKNPHFKTTYADLSSVVSAIKPALSENGMFFAQITHEQAGGVCVETIVCHETGEQMSFGKLFVPASKSDAQGYGSALTYARRYSLMTAFGVCPEDDDGNHAVRSTPEAPAEKKPANSALKTKVRAFVHEINGCGDGDELSAFLATPDAIKLIAEVRDKMPDWWEGSDEMPAEFVPLAQIITQRQQECAQASAEYLRG